MAETPRGTGVIAVRTVRKLLRRVLDSDLSRLGQVDATLTDRLARIEVELRVAQEAQGRQVAALEAQVRVLRERLDRVK